MIFDCKESTENIVDKIRHQWGLYQLEDIPEHFFLKPINDTHESTRVQESYWSYASELCGFASVQKRTSKYVRIDSYWAKIGKLLDGNGGLKYPQLFYMVKCVLSLSHGNSVPERGFSINKILLDAHGYSIKEDTIIALRFVKDELHRIGGATKFVISRGLIESCKTAHARSVAAEEKEQEEKKKNSVQAIEANKKEKALQEQKKELESIEHIVSICKKNLDVAESIVEEGNNSLKALILDKNVDRQKLVAAQAKIDMGLKRKKSIENEIEELLSKKRKIQKRQES